MKAWFFALIMLGGSALAALPARAAQQGEAEASRTGRVGGPQAVEESTAATYEHLAEAIVAIEQTAAGILKVGGIFVHKSESGDR